MTTITKPLNYNNQIITIILSDAVWLQMLNQADDKETKEAMKATKEKVDSFYQKNDAELQAIRDLIEVHRL